MKTDGVIQLLSDWTRWGDSTVLSKRAIEVNRPYLLPIATNTPTKCSPDGVSPHQHSANIDPFVRGAAPQRSPNIDPFVRGADHRRVVWNIERFLELRQIRQRAV